MKKDRISYFTCEHVSPAHPDKVMDGIAESIVDAYFEQDMNSRVAIDGAVKGEVFLCGEISSNAVVDKLQISKNHLEKIGYVPRDEESAKFNCRDLVVHEQFTEQSQDIAQGVDRYEDLADKTAGDIGFMVGGAVNESPNLVSHAQEICSMLSRYLFESSPKVDWMRPDIKTQCTIKYVNDNPVSVDTIVVCQSHSDDVTLDFVIEQVKKMCFPVIEKYCVATNLSIDEDFKFYVNPTGKFSVYGPQSDSGEVGRKIIVDQTHGSFPVGGGNLNGKDATKVDRSGVYITRYVAKNIVASGLADKCHVAVSYAIGMKNPTSIQVECYGTNKADEQVIEDAVKEVFDFTPGGIIKQFKLISPQAERGFKYQDLGMYGHVAPYGVEVPWELTDRTNDILSKINDLNQRL